jgi:hypothetical protein
MPGKPQNMSAMMFTMAPPCSDMYALYASRQHRKVPVRFVSITCSGISWVTHQVVSRRHPQSTHRIPALGANALSRGGKLATAVVDLDSAVAPSAIVV